jgi:hypothetical protein
MVNLDPGKSARARAAAGKAAAVRELFYPKRENGIFRRYPPHKFLGHPKTNMPDRAVKCTSLPAARSAFRRIPHEREDRRIGKRG